MSTKCRNPTKCAHADAAASKAGCQFGLGLAITHVTQHTPTAKELTTLASGSSSDSALSATPTLEPL
jgi:hypothetical protein